MQDVKEQITVQLPLLLLLPLEALEVLQLQQIFLIKLSKEMTPYI